MIDRTHEFHILLVEDDPADAHLIRLAFDESKLLLSLDHVEDGQEALDYLQRKPPYTDTPMPDLILLDLNMPRMNGRQFLERVKKLDVLRRIPVVILTTSDAESDIVASYDLGAAGYIVKPVDIDDFIRQVQRLEEYWITLVKRPLK